MVVPIVMSLIHYMPLRVINFFHVDLNELVLVAAVPVRTNTGLFANTD